MPAKFSCYTVVHFTTTDEWTNCSIMEENMKRPVTSYPFQLAHSKRKSSSSLEECASEQQVDVSTTTEGLSTHFVVV